MTVASTSRPGAFLRSFGPAALACLGATAALGQSVKLSGPLAQPVGGNVGAFAVTPDGSRVVYVGDQEIDERFELYVVPSDGSQPPLKISDPLDGNVRYASGLMTLDGSAVVYVTDQPGLFRAPLDGGSAPVQLAGGIAIDPADFSEDPFRYEMSPDGAWVVYRENDPPQLRAVRVDGSAPPVAIGIATAVITSDFRISADSQRVVFRAGVRDNRLVLYSVPIDGSASPTRLNANFFDTRQTVGGFLITPDSQRVAYSADQDVPEVFETYTIPIGGGASTGLNGTLPVFSDSFPVAITPDSTRVLFKVDLATNERYDLYVIPLDASAPAVRLGANHASIYPNGILSVRLSEDGSRVVYMTSGRELYSAPIEGGSFLRLSQPGANVLDYEVTPGGHVPFQAYLESSKVIDLFTVPADGGYRGRTVRAPRIRRIAQDVLNHFQVHPDGSTLAFLSHDPNRLFVAPVDGHGPAVELFPQYVGYALTPGDRVLFSPLPPLQFPGGHLYSIPLAGGTPVRLNTDLPLGPVLGRIKTFATSPDGQWAAYMAEGELRFKHELYVSPTDGSEPARKLSPDSGEAGGYAPQAGMLRFTHDSARIVYLADHDVRNTLDLYVVPVDGSTPPERLTAMTGSYGVRPGFELTPQGDHAVGLAQVPGSSAYQLFSVRLDGSAPAVQLSGATGATSFRVSPDSSRVVYADYSSNRESLRSVPVEGGPSVELQGIGAFTADLGEYVISADGVWVVYRYDAGFGSSVPQLHSIPADASGPRLTFGGTGGAVGSFELTPDGQGVVYLRQVNGPSGSFELLLAPLDASSWLPLNPPSAQGPYSAALGFRVSPDGTRVALLADQEADGEVAFYSLPLDGSQQLTPLTPNFPIDSSPWQDFVLSPDGSSVLYFSDVADPGVDELYSVPLAGGSPPVRLNGPSASGAGFTLVFQQPLPIAMAGGRVAYALDQDQPGRFELFVGPVDGAHAARKVNEPLLGAPSESLPFAFAGLTQLVYLAAQDLPDVPELFARPLAGIPHHLPR